MSEHTPGPWVQFSDQGKCVAIMPAGREGDICTFQQLPTDADARLMTLAPSLLKALERMLRFCDEANEYEMQHPADYSAYLDAKALLDLVSTSKDPG